MPWSLQNSTAWALLGHCCYLSGDVKSALDAYERVVEYADAPPDLHTVLLRLGDLYTGSGKVSRAHLRRCGINELSVLPSLRKQSRHT